MIRKKIREWNLIRLFYLISFGVLFVGCDTKNNQQNRLIFNKLYECDSLSNFRNEFIIDKDGSAYSLQENSPFEFKFSIDSEYIVLRNSKYNYIHGGLNNDTIGLINIADDKYLFLDRESSNPLLLFDFRAKTNNSWNIEKGYFNGYEITLAERKFNSILNDSVYYYDFNYIKTRFPNGYYFVQFEVSPKIGVIGFKFNNGIHCSSLNDSSD